MADETPKPAAAIPRTTRPMSEALLNEKVQFESGSASGQSRRTTPGIGR